MTTPVPRLNLTGLPKIQHHNSGSKDHTGLPNNHTGSPKIQHHNSGSKDHTGSPNNHTGLPKIHTGLPKIHTSSTAFQFNQHYNIDNSVKKFIKRFRKTQAAKSNRTQAKKGITKRTTNRDTFFDTTQKNTPTPNKINTFETTEIDLSMNQNARK